MRQLLDPNTPVRAVAMRVSRRGLVVLIVVAMAAVSRTAHAGPPYTTDDPEPVEFRHWEVYLASQFAFAPGGAAGTGPHLELNYGAHEDIQLHVIAPLAWSLSERSLAYGAGDPEFGIKWRFIHETRYFPQVGTFTMFDIAAGDERRGLGSGHTSVFFPIWLQKSWGPWTSYGGGGFALHPRASEFDHWYFGWQIQRRLASWLTIGGESFVTTAFSGQPAQIGFNAGAVFDVTAEHHILVSLGARFDSQPWPQGYVAYQWTVGPRE
jgi:hypothetical protein